MSAALLDIVDLTAGVGSVSTPAILDHVSLTVGDGERVALVGPSGAGKSTLVRLASGLNRPVSRRGGTVTFCGKDVFRLSAGELRDLRRRNLAFVPQNPASALDPLMTLGRQWQRNLETSCAPADPTSAGDILARLALPSRLDAYPHTWSRGMQQRLLVAMALARRPRLLILDEPTSALDPILAAEMIQAIDAAARRQGMALMMITHHEGLAASLCDRLLRVDRGRVGAAPAAATAGPDREPKAPTGVSAVAGDPPARPMVEVETIVVRRAGRVVLDGISFAVAAGEALAIVGESGAGKTTLASAILGLLPLASGRCTVASRLPGVVFQDPLGALNPSFRAELAIAEPLLAQGVKRPDALAKARTLADDLGLARPLMSRLTHDLSVGQAQRVCIARALIANPDIILLDEPLSALDRAHAHGVIATLQHVRKQLRPTLLIVTHDLDFARRIADRILVLRHGRVIEHASSGAFFAGPRTSYGRALVAAAKAVGEFAEPDAA